MALRIEVTGEILTPSQRYRLSQGLLKAAREKVPGVSVLLATRFLAKAPITPQIEISGDALTAEQQECLVQGLLVVAQEILAGIEVQLIFRFRHGNQVTCVPPVPPQTPLKKLGLRDKTLGFLADAGIDTIGALKCKTELDLLELSGIGRSRLTEIIRVLAAHGHTLAE